MNNIDYEIMELNTDIKASLFMAPDEHIINVGNALPCILTDIAFIDEVSASQFPFTGRC